MDLLAAGAPPSVCHCSPTVIWDRGRIVATLDDEREEYHLTTQWEHDREAWADAAKTLLDAGYVFAEDDRSVEYLPGGALRHALWPPGGWDWS